MLRDAQGWLDRVARITLGLTLPLTRAGGLTGVTKHGAGAPEVLPLSNGVVVLRRGRLSLFSEDLHDERWGQELPGDLANWNRTLLTDEASVLVGPIDGSVRLHDCRSGSMIGSIPGDGLVLAAGNAAVLLTHGRTLSAVDWEGRRLWSRPCLAGQVVVASGRFLVTENLNRRLVCIDAKSGEECWRFTPGLMREGTGHSTTTEIPSGYPSVAVSGDRVFVYPMDRHIYVLALASGEVMTAMPRPFRGLSLTGPESIFFMSPRELVEVRCRSMHEVSRAEYWEDVAPLYQGAEPKVTGFALTTESVVWGGGGTLMGVSRRSDRSGKRRTWAERIPGAIMPLAVAPVVYGNYLYFVDLREPFQILCFRSV